MTIRMLGRPAAASVLGVALMLATPSAQAGFKVRISDQTNPLSIPYIVAEDNNTSTSNTILTGPPLGTAPTVDDQSAAAGNILLLNTGGAFAGFTASSSVTATSGSADVAGFLFSNLIAFTTGSFTGTKTIVLEVTSAPPPSASGFGGFTTPLGLPLLATATGSISTSAGGTAGNDVTYVASVGIDSAAAEFATSGSGVFSTPALAGEFPSGVASSALTLGGVPGNPTSATVLTSAPTSGYGITQVFRFEISPNTSYQIQGNVSVSAVPEPGTLAMAFLAGPLLGLGYYRHRRRPRA